MAAGRCGLPRLNPAEEVEPDEELLASLPLCAALLTRSLDKERKEKLACSAQAARLTRNLCSLQTRKPELDDTFRQATNFKMTTDLMKPEQPDNKHKVESFCGSNLTAKAKAHSCTW